MDGLEGVQREFEFNSLHNQEPVESLKNGGDVMV